MHCSTLNPSLTVSTQLVAILIPLYGLEVITAFLDKYHNLKQLIIWLFEWSPIRRTLWQWAVSNRHLSYKRKLCSRSFHHQFALFYWQHDFDSYMEYLTMKIICIESTLQIENSMQHSRKSISLTLVIGILSEIAYKILQKLNPWWTLILQLLLHH